MGEEQKRGRGRPVKEHKKTPAERQAAYRARKKVEIEALKRNVTQKRPPTIGILEAQVVLLNAELLTRTNQLEAAQNEIAGLKAR